MAQCCVIPHTGDPPVCPMNEQVVKPVGRITVETLVKPEIKSQLLPQPYYFCNAPDCDTVYVSALGDHLITKDQLSVRVGIKEQDDPIPICYCFNFDRQAIQEDFRNKGSTEILKIITARVKAGECQCELTNPSGTCCLGDVSRAVKQAEAMHQQGLL